MPLNKETGTEIKADTERSVLLANLQFAFSYNVPTK